MARGLLWMAVAAVVFTSAAGCGNAVNPAREKAIETQLAETQKRLRDAELGLQSAKADAEDAMRKRDEWQKEVDRRTLAIGDRDVQIITLKTDLQKEKVRFDEFKDELARMRADLTAIRELLEAGKRDTPRP